MSTRLLNAMAEGIKNSTIGIDGVARELLIQNIICQLAMVHPRFNADRFRKACTPAPVGKLGIR
jgi:hypothetical protein